MDKTGKKYMVMFSLVHSELDNFKEGCDPSTSSSRFLDEPLTFEANTLKELLKEIKKFFNVSQDGLLLNSCDEIGRLDVQTYSLTLDGLRCSYNRTVSEFRTGKRNLWLNNISGEVTKIESPDLVKELEIENRGV
ncbi:MAG: hypothetical protein GY804_03920 [Alphaproteobacteria bacterium]|nr:hypothetical protein [Alphaproteobacteria bacterium]